MKNSRQLKYMKKVASRASATFFRKYNEINNYFYCNQLHLVTEALEATMILNSKIDKNTESGFCFNVTSRQIRISRQHDFTAQTEFFIGSFKTEFSI